jgi:hypothetical protein
MGCAQSWGGWGKGMSIVRRLSLVGFVLVAPPLLTALFYIGSQTLLHATSRTIEPEFLWYAAMIELPVFFVFAVLEAKNRW